MPFSLTSPHLLPIVLLIGSNLFMTLAWYGHLRFKEAPLIRVIFAAWGIAFIEYCMAVPANRWGQCGLYGRRAQDHAGGHYARGLRQVSAFYLKEPLAWNHAVGFALITAGAFFVFQKW